MKKLAGVLTAMALLLSCTACGQSSTPSGQITSVLSDVSMTSGVNVSDGESNGQETKQNSNDQSMLSNGQQGNQQSSANTPTNSRQQTVSKTVSKVSATIQNSTTTQQTSSVKPNGNSRVPTNSSKVQNPSSVSSKPNGGGSGTQDGKIYINEFMASNGAIYPTEEGKYEDWIELYNPSSKAINLEGYYLSDDAKNPLRWRFPKVELPAKGYLVVFASGEDRISSTKKQIHTNFKINKAGESLILTSPDKLTAVDQFLGISIVRDKSYGRTSDGASNWKLFDKPTPGAANH